MPFESTEKSPPPGTTRHRTLYVGALAKGLRVLRAFDETGGALSLGELAQRTGLDKSAVQRLANTLHLEGMLDKDPVTRHFRPAHSWLELAHAYYWSNPLVAAAMPKLIELSRALGETVNLAEMSGDHIIYLYRLPCKRTQFSAMTAGRRVPALSTTCGRVILSTWPAARRDAAIETWPLKPFTLRTTLDRDLIRRDIEAACQTGYVIAHHQIMLNETAIAAPIPGPDGISTAAVQCSVSAHSWTRERVVHEILPMLQDTANGITPTGP